MGGRSSVVLIDVVEPVVAAIIEVLSLAADTSIYRIIAGFTDSPERLKISNVLH